MNLEFTLVKPVWKRSLALKNKVCWLYIGSRVWKCFDSFDNEATHLLKTVYK